MNTSQIFLIIATRGWFPVEPCIPFVLMATLVLAHCLLDRKIALHASATVVFWASCIAIWSRLEATRFALTESFWFAQLVFGGVLVSMFASWQQMTRLLSMAGITCKPPNHPPVDWAK